MLIRLGYELALDLPQETPVVTALEIHADRRKDIRWESGFVSRPAIPTEVYSDAYGNRCRRFLAPAGRFVMRYDALVEDSGMTDAVVRDAELTPVGELPTECIGYLLGSRYCETDHLADLAWKLFGHTKPGWERVQAIVDYAHERLSFGYGYARSTRTAAQAHEEQVGVCRDFAHLAIALCRCMNIPARYVNGYLGDINVPADPAPMDFSAWMEAYVGGRWHTFDARHNVPRTGRVVIARGRDATDVPLVHTFGPHSLPKFEVWTYEQESQPAGQEAPFTLPPHDLFAHRVAA